MTKHVAVLLGGWSAEREVSLVSGKECADALERAGYRVTRIDPPRDLGEFSKALSPAPDVVFNALHGQWGEDGAIQSLLDIMAIPYTHSGRLASAVAMDKPMSVALCRAAGIPCADGREVDLEEFSKGDPMARPYVVKPAREGSSVGVYIVLEGSNGPDLSGWTYGAAMIEEYIPGRELTVSVKDGKAMAVTELRPRQGFYDYEAKYTDGKTDHLIPAPIPDDLRDKAMGFAERAHETLGCRGISRSDFRYDDKAGRLVFLELNTQPGMTPLSLVPEQAAHLGTSFEELVSWMVENAACDA